MDAVLEDIRKWRASLSPEDLETLKFDDNELYGEDGLPERSGSHFDLTDIETITVHDGQVVHKPKSTDKA